MGGKIKSSGDIQSMLNYSTECPDYCFYRLFYNCTGLTTAPYLSAEKIGKYSYGNMFAGCTGLTTAPELPVTKLVNGCYDYMFVWAENISNIKVNFTSWVDDNSESCTTQWVGGVDNTGTFTCPSELQIERGVHRIPEGWEVNNA